MNRIEVIQKIIYTIKAKIYYEIGIYKGDCFLKIKAREKIGIDPSHEVENHLKWNIYLKNFSNIHNKFFFKESNNFFIQDVDFIVNNKPDVIFIDGLHNYKQTYSDIINSLSLLSKNGIIIVHDCFPPTEAAATPANTHEEAIAKKVPGWTGEWCGDVWKAIVMLKSNNTDVLSFVLNCDYGLGIIRKGNSFHNPNLSEIEIEQLTYKDLLINKTRFLDLKEGKLF